jgi:hypothetical protein
MHNVLSSQFPSFFLSSDLICSFYMIFHFDLGLIIPTLGPPTPQKRKKKKETTINKLVTCKCLKIFTFGFYCVMLLCCKYFATFISGVYPYGNN